MGMCKGCEEVFNANDMVGGYCQNCLTDEIIEQTEKKEKDRKEGNNIGFQWWIIWGWLGITIGNIQTLGTLGDIRELAFTLIVINTIVMIFVLRFNKYAFLIGTIISLNPLLWIINGIYLKNRWNNPNVNGGVTIAEPNQTNSTLNNFCTECGKEVNTNGKFCPQCGNKI